MLFRSFPVVTPDERWVIYTETGTLKFTLWKVGIDGGTPVQLTDQLSTWPVVSPDGTRIVTGGDDGTALADPHYRQLVHNAVRWVGSPAARDWVRERTSAEREQHA